MVKDTCCNMEIYPLDLEILAAFAKFVPICRKNDILGVSTNAAGDTKQLAFLMVSGISRILLGVHPPLWKFFFVNLEILAAVFKFVPIYEKIDDVNHS